MTDRLREIREREYPNPPEGIFLNAASWGIVPASSARAVADLALARNRTHGFEERELGAIQHRARAAVAELIGAQSNEIALAPNTSFGVNLAAHVLRAGRPGVIVVSEGEFPANVLPFRALEPDGFSIRIVPVAADGNPDEDALLREIADPGVVALTVSAVQFSTGFVADLSRLGTECRSRGIRFFVDAIQAIGATPYDVRDTPADLVACGGQKWLCSPWGSGFVWMSDEMQARIDPPMVSWLATAGGADFSDMSHYRMDWRSNARKFELATLGIQDYLGMACSIEVLLEVGVETIRDHIHRLHEPVLDWIDAHAEARCVTPRSSDRRAGILAFRLSDPDAVARVLTENSVVFSVREGLVRFAPHFYNTLEEMHEVVRLLDSVL